ncbi:unnamed protein product [Rotaria sordida]|uniref:Uncharacterized protein n=1 Tax=Rotaria sordida TaxID=392033 RepID=A0A813ZZ76_9BILA|nr:unnamed protein product [Rotaria sordida]
MNKNLLLLILSKINDQCCICTEFETKQLGHLSILIFCLGQAARVTSKCDKFHCISLAMRVYGYHTSSTDLDGFLLFLSSAKLYAKLFGLTVRPRKIISILVTTIIVGCVILLQTNIIHSSSFFIQ